MSHAPEWLYDGDVPQSSGLERFNDLRQSRGFIKDYYQKYLGLSKLAGHPPALAYGQIFLVF